jgi:hypothetical protein
MSACISDVKNAVFQLKAAGVSLIEEDIITCSYSQITRGLRNFHVQKGKRKEDADWAA